LFSCTCSVNWFVIRACWQSNGCAPQKHEDATLKQVVSLVQAVSFDVLHYGKHFRVCKYKHSNNNIPETKDNWQLSCGCEKWVLKHFLNETYAWKTRKQNQKNDLMTGQYNLHWELFITEIWKDHEIINSARRSSISQRYKLIQYSY